MWAMTTSGDRDRGEGVVLGDPETAEPEAVDVPGERQRVAQGVAGGTADTAWSLVED
jgi:hypothetical protein